MSESITLTPNPEHKLCLVAARTATEGGRLQNRAVTLFCFSTVGLKRLLLLLGVFGTFTGSAQPVERTDTLRATRAETMGVPAPKSEVVSLLLYNRAIVDAQGNVRFDQNVVPTFRLDRTLKLQIGFRVGERPHIANAYYHYKVELQTRRFWNVLRLLARMSTNVINNPGPAGGVPYTRSNYLGVAEGHHPLSKKFRLLGGLGYVYTFQKNNYLDGFPVSDGLPKAHLIYKAALNYAFSERGFVGIAFGTYDVFNPYNLNEPFAQVDSEYDISGRSTLYAYFRYQEAGHFYEPLNGFIGLGIRLHFYKR